MSESEPKRINIKPEDILTTPEAELIQKADREELACPRCGQPIMSEKIMVEVYEGVKLVCSNLTGCGFREH